MSNEHIHFIERLEYGHIDDVELNEYLLTHIVPRDDRLYMAERRFDITMIVNGRLPTDTYTEIKQMVMGWNETLGYQAIHAEDW